MNKLKFIIFLIFTSVITNAQNLTIKGQLEDANQLPLSYVNITFERLNGTDVFKQTQSDENGDFEIKIPEGDYAVVFQPPMGGLINRSYTFKTNTNLGVINLSTSSINLSGIEVEAQKPLYRLELDKRVYDMERDPTVKGATISDALNNVPSVTVDSDGTISLRGNSNLQVLIDGKRSSMTGISDVGEALKNLPADAVQRVEVITNPSARYQASGTGGIINIIMKKGANQGFNANFNASVGNPLEAGLSASLNYKTKKWNFFTSPFIRYSKPEGKSYFKNTFFNENGPDTIEIQNGKRIRERFNRGITIGLEHYIDDKNTIGLSGNYRKSTSDNSNTLSYQDLAGENIFSESQRIEKQDRTDDSYEADFNYKHEFNNKGHELTFDASTSWSIEDEDANINEFVISGIGDAQLDRTKNIESQTRNLLKLDYVFPHGESSRFEFGYRGEWEKNGNDFEVETQIDNEWVSKPNFTDYVDYKQNIQALYTQYGSKLDQFSFLLGLRMEYSDISIFSRSADDSEKKNYTDWFPSATLNYTIDEYEENQIQLSYSRRIRRPRSRFLSPFGNYSDDRNIFIGNPDLDPTFNDSYELAYITRIGKVDITPSIYYRHSKNEMNVFRRLSEINGNSVFIAQPVNVGNQNSYGAELVVSAPITSWWRLFTNLNWYKYKMDAIYDDPISGNSFDLSSDNSTVFARVSNNFKLPWEVNFQLNGGYYGPRENAQSRSKGIIMIDMGLNKDILNGNGTLSLNVRDLLNSRRRKNTTYGENYISEMDMQWRPRQVSLSLSYRINQDKKRQRQDNQNMDDDAGIEF